MRQFNTPPGWPDPPNARWRPPKRWGPAEAWPPAPDGWRFWVDEDGRPVRGPLGLYGGPSIVKVGSVVTVVLALIGLVLFNPFAGGADPETTVAAPTTTETTPTAGTTTAPETEAPTPAGATTAPTTQPSSEPTPAPTPTPQPTEPRTSAPSTPKATPTPTEPSSAPTTTITAVVYKNCAEVRAAGKAPLHRGDPGYSAELDNNGDGTACGRGNS